MQSDGDQLAGGSGVGIVDDGPVGGARRGVLGEATRGRCWQQFRLTVRTARRTGPWSPDDDRREKVTDRELNANRNRLIERPRDQVQADGEPCRSGRSGQVVGFGYSVRMSGW